MSEYDGSQVVDMSMVEGAIEDAKFEEDPEPFWNADFLDLLAAMNEGSKTEKEVTDYASETLIGKTLSEVVKLDL